MPRRENKLFCRWIYILHITMISVSEHDKTPILNKRRQYYINVILLYCFSQKQIYVTHKIIFKLP